MLRHARRLLAARDELTRELADQDGELAGHLVVGSSTGLGEHVLPTLLGGFRAAPPGGLRDAPGRGHGDGDRPRAGARAGARRCRRYARQPCTGLRAVSGGQDRAGRPGRPPVRGPHHRARRAGGRAADRDAGGCRRAHRHRGRAAPRRRAGARPADRDGDGAAGVGEGGGRGGVRRLVPVVAGARPRAAAGHAGHRRGRRHRPGARVLDGAPGAHATQPAGRGVPRLLPRRLSAWPAGAAARRALPPRPVESPARPRPSGHARPAAGANRHGSTRPGGAGCRPCRSHLADRWAPANLGRLLFERAHHGTHRDMRLERDPGMRESNLP